MLLDISILGARRMLCDEWRVAGTPEAHLRDLAVGAGGVEAPDSGEVCKVQGWVVK